MPARAYAVSAPSRSLKFKRSSRERRGRRIMSWKTAYRSVYYENAEPPADIRLDPETTALLVIDVQNVYLAPKDSSRETARWEPFYARMRETVIPNIARLIRECRSRGVEIIFARIACHKQNGRDRS